jgi:Glycosyl hydrolase family 12
MQRFNSLPWRSASASVLVVAFSIMAMQPSAASVPPSRGGAASTAERIGTPPVARDAAAALSTCNGPTFSPPTSDNTTNAGSASFLPLTNGVATPNLWNVDQSAGAIRQCYNADSGFKDTINLSSLSLGLATAPAGFPEIGYGESSYGEHFCGPTAATCKMAPFPIAVSSFARYPYLARVSYSVGAITPAQYLHLTYDLWLERSISGNGPQAGDVEIMIAPYNTYPACGAARPAFKTAGMTWNVTEGCGGAKATTLHFTLKSSEQHKAGTFTLNLSSFVAESKKLLPGDTSIASEKMAGMEIGVEFNNYGCSGSGCSAQKASAQFSWTVSALSLIRYSPVPKKSVIYHVVG